MTAGVPTAVPTATVAAGIDIKLPSHAGKRIICGHLAIIVDGHVIGGIGVAPAPARRTAGGERGAGPCTGARRFT